MLIGTGKNKRVAEVISNLNCPNCRARGSLLMEGYQEFLILGLPAFPISKTVVVTCISCKKYFPPSEISNEMYGGIQYIKSKIKPTVWMFLLPAVMGVIIFFASVSSIKTASGNISKIESVKAGDIYTVETGNLRYNKMKVLFVKNNAVVFHESGHSSVKMRKLKYIDRFYGDTIILMQQDLLKLNNDNKIEEINRD